MANPGGRIDYEKQLQELQKDAFYLSNYYFLFQGVIFTAFYNGSSSSLKCHFRWLPFTLSSLAGALNLSALLVIAFRYKDLLDRADEDLITTLANPRDPRLSPHSPPPVIWYERRRRLVILVCCMAFFIGFFVVTLYGSLKIPCWGTEEPYSTDNSNNCINLCDSANCITMCQNSN